MSVKKEYGDFQTPESLAKEVVGLVSRLFQNPDYVVEPNVGLGRFLHAAASMWKSSALYHGYEINKEYVEFARKSLKNSCAEIFHADFFSENWSVNLQKSGKPRVLVLGNPPWVTNSVLGQLGSSNLPSKSNFQGLRGFEARTGKSNFDIAEWMLIRLIEALPPTGALAMLCKTMTARKVLRYFWKTDGGRSETRIFKINAKAEFDVSVDACLFFITGQRTDARVASVHDDLDLLSESSRFGFVDGDIISNIEMYESYRYLNGGSHMYKWRSGIKHDAAAIMEFAHRGERLVNGLGETVDLEPDYVFPLLKSSDLGNGRVSIRKSVLVTQRSTGDDTIEMERNAPKTWSYLMRHSEVLDQRKSSIYANRPRFSVFGVGAYSFAPWKVAISGLYKAISFVVVPPYNEKPVMVDDTCYSLPCYSQEEAELLASLLSSVPAVEFLSSLIFQDSKRPVTIDVLRRLSIVELARSSGNLDRLESISQKGKGNGSKDMQLSLLIEPKNIFGPHGRGK